MRALLDLLRDIDEAEFQDFELHCVLHSASRHLTILDPEHGEEELVKSMEVASAKFLG